MTQRSEFQHFKLETKAKVMNWVANRLLSSKEDGMDGFVKRRVLPPARGSAGRERARS